MTKGGTEGGCSRRGVMCGFSALSVLGLAGMSPLVACGGTVGIVGKDAGTVGQGGAGDTGDGGSTTISGNGTDGGGSSTGDGVTGDAGSTGGADTSVCDASNAICIDLANTRNAAALGSVGDYGYLSITGDTLIVVHLGDGVFDVLSAICTHQGCQVSYRDRQDDIFCACHNSDFDLDGNVISGPAPRPLRHYPSELQGDTLVIHI
ncbi:MAG: Rieske (2Fe-2S) protein [Oligoflexia bacterium]|nr:Rieske (2Fe-2S) protein [Oligoflexia bacterium]